MAWNTVLFDLDGTLTDPAEGIVNSILYALERMGIVESDPRELTDFIGPPLHESFGARYRLSRQEAFRAVDFYREYFTDRGIFENRVIAGIPELLRDLSRKGCRLLLATSKPTVYARRILDYFRLSPFFTRVQGAELDGTRTRKAEVIRAALEGATLPEAAVMVGDRGEDVRAARENGLPAVAVAWGYGTKREFNAAAADYRAATVAELRRILEAS